MIDFNAIEEEYLTERPSDDDRMHDLKERIRSLTEAERRILFLYSDEGSYCGTARVLRCSPTTIKKYIDRIRIKIC